MPNFVNTFRSAWGEILGYVVAAAITERLVHHAEILALKGDSSRHRHIGRIEVIRVATD
jgi:DNA replication protein DnaC